MQRVCSKFVAGLTLIFFLFVTNLSAQNPNATLKTADSLFQARRYTQSLDLYNQILRQKQYTSAMLLKMAFIQEGLNNVGDAMYYLNLYFLATNDNTVLDKMEELAKKHNLEGYEASESDEMLTFYHKNYFYITLALAALALLAFSLIFYTRTKLHRKPIASIVALSLVLIGLFVHLNLGSRVSMGIITNATTYVMDGPSAGASVVEIVTGGHRVEVIGKEDIWMEIKWEGNTAYVRQNSILPINL